MSKNDNSATKSTNNSGAGAGGGSGGEGAESGGRLAAVGTKAADAYQSARDRTSAAYSAARERAGSVGQRTAQRTAETIETAPLAAVVGGIALGAIAGALLPRTQREEQLLGATGRKITDRVREATEAARDAGRSQLDGFTDRAVTALKSSAGAAAESVRNR